jgi:RHS repeat-associated protein
MAWSGRRCRRRRCGRNYDGDEIYGDYAIDPATGSEVQKTAYLAGVGQVDVATGAVMYYHADHLGTTRATSDGTGALSAPAVYTAFGENVASDGSIGGVGIAGTRYQYAGAWGYESGLLPSIDLGSGNSFPSLPWQHVGHRWYDPSTGRFLQRDPIGILGGSNVYEYARSSPSSSVDPDGLMTPGSWWPNTGIIRYGPSRVGWDAAGKGVYQIAFRAGSSLHLYGLRGAACFGLAVTGAAAVGAGIGIGLDYAVEAATGTSLSDRIGNGFHRLWPGGPWSWWI